MKFDQTIQAKKGMPSIYYGDHVRSMDGSLVAANWLVSAYQAATGTGTEGMATIAGMMMTSNGLWYADPHHIFFANQLAFSATDTLKTVVTDTDDNSVEIGGRYVSHNVKTTLAGSLASAETSTMSLTDATDFPTSGDVIILGSSELSSTKETISYTGKSGNSLTGLTRGTNNSTQQIHWTGYTVVGFVDEWADIGETASYRPAVLHNDFMFVGNGHYIAGWNDADASTFSTNLLDLPVGYEVRTLTSAVIGNQRMVIIGAIRGNDSALFLWDGADTTWARRIDIPGTITCMTETYIVTQRAIFQTDGYIVSPLFQFPGGEPPTIISVATRDHYLYLLSSLADATTIRRRGGLWILDLLDKTLTHTSMSTASAGSGKVVFAKTAYVYVGGTSEIDRLDPSRHAKVSSIWIPYAPSTGRKLRLTDLFLSVGEDILTGTSQTDYDTAFRTIVRVAPMTEHTGKMVELATGVSTTTFTCSAAVASHLSVGDRVEFTLGQIRQIVSISTAASPLITIDEALAATPSNSTYFLWTPNMRQVADIQTTGAIVPEDMHIVVNQQPTGFGFMVEVEFRLTEYNQPAPVLRAIEFVGNIL